MILFTNYNEKKKEIRVTVVPDELRKDQIHHTPVAGKIPSSLVVVFLHPPSPTLTTIILVRNPFSTKLISLSMNLKLLWMIDFLISITS